MPGTQGLLLRSATSLSAARAEETKRANEARSRGASSIDTHFVDGVFSMIFGTLVGGWWFGWFDPKLAPAEHLIGRLRGRGISVVVFELDGVMCAGRNAAGVPEQELEERLQGVSQDFVEAASALARRGFHLAAVASGPRAAAPPPAPPRARRGGGAAPAAPRAATGPEFARALLARWCPEAAPSFRVVLEALAEAGEQPGARADGGVREIAAFYGVPVEEVALFTACPGSRRSGVEGWTGVLVRDPAEGFRMDDSLELAPPSRFGLSAVLDVASSLWTQGREWRATPGSAGDPKAHA